MDHHPSMINEPASSSYPSANGSSSYNLAEIWQFPLTGGGVGEFGGVLGARAAHFGGSSGGFTEARTGNRDVLVEGSTVTEQSGRSGAGSGKRRDATVSEDESSKLVSTSSGNEMNDSDVKRFKVSESREENGDSKPDVGASSRDGNKQAEQSTKQLAEPPKQDYIHVRARRGQATDSHSLAERARREKISERMKILQDLVPGCNKVIGKAMVLDEIINYIQSLQRQVEFLSMKLEAVNSRINPNIEGFPSKDAFDNAGMAFSSQAAREYGQGSPQEWLHMQVGGSFERAP